MKKIIITSRMAIWSLSESTPYGQWNRQADNQLLKLNNVDKWVLISISGHDEDLISNEQFKVLQGKGCLDILLLKFDDINGRIFKIILEKYEKRGYDIKKENFVYFSDNDAEAIIEFADRHKNIETMIIHCAAGISRSGATGCFLAEKYGISAKNIFDAHPYLEPNEEIVNRLFSVAGRDYQNFLEWFYRYDNKVAQNFPIDYRLNI